jgi:hypothetical protein
MIKPIKLNDNHIDTEKVSFIGAIDSRVNHSKNPACSYYFTIVVDGKDVDISSHNAKEVKELRDRLVRFCNPDYCDP